MRVVEVNDPAIDERGRDQALASQDALATESLVQNFYVAHAVEQRQDDGIWSDRRRERSDRAFKIVSFATEQNEIEGVSEVFLQGGGRPGKSDIAEAATNLDLGGQLGGPPGADEEVTSRLTSSSRPPK